MNWDGTSAKSRGTLEEARERVGGGGKDCEKKEGKEAEKLHG